MTRLGATLAGLTILLATVSVSSTVGAQTPQKKYTIALYTPDVAFRDSISKTTYINGVAKELTFATGLAFEGISFARSRDYVNRAEAGDVDFAIVSGAVFAESARGTPIAYASGSQRLVLLTKSASSVYQLKGKRLILPRTGGGILSRYVSATVLGGEVQAKEFFKVSFTKDAASAIAALNLGQADATLTFESYAGGGLNVAYRCPGGGLPVVVTLNKDLDKKTTTRVAAAFHSIAVKGAGIMGRFAGDARGIKHLRATAGRKPRTKRLLMTEGRPATLNLGQVSFEGLDMTPEAGRSIDLVPNVEVPESDW